MNIIKNTPPKGVNQISSDYVLSQVGMSTLEAYALKNGSKGIKAIPHTIDKNSPVKVTVTGHSKLNGWYSIPFLASLNLI